jgi:integrase
LWPETVKACKAALRQRVERTSGPAVGLAFATKFGAPWVKAAGNDDAIAKEFRDLCIDAGINRKGVGFYGLRRSFATVGSECKDQPAVDSIMGHRDGSMSARYRQRISDERLKAVTDYVYAWLWKTSRKS